MRTKGITFWEQHVEHFVLGIAVLVFVAFCATQFLGNPNSVELPGQRTKVGPSEVDRLIEDHARALLARMSPEAAPAQPVPHPEPLKEKFQERLTSSISPQPQLALWSPRIGPDAGLALSAGPADKPFVVAKVPPPQNVIAIQYYETLSPETVAQHEELKKIVPNEPYDVTFITVAAKLNVKSVLDQFANGANGQAALPQKWYDHRVDIIDARFERVEVVNGKADESTRTLLEPIPGQQSFRKQLGSRVDMAMRNDILKFVADPAGRSQIIQPEFFVGLANEWTPPGSVETVAGNVPLDDDPIRDLKNYIDRKKKERERQQKKMKDNNCPEQPPAEAPRAPKKPPTRPGGTGGGKTPPPVAPPGPPGGGGGGAGGGMGPGAPMGDEGSTSTKPANESACRQIRERLRRLDLEIAKAQEELQRLEGAAAKVTEKPVEAEESAKPDELEIWAHDMNIKPGKTYRYRVSVHIFNPLFARKPDLMPAQQPLSEQFTIASPVSEWSEPITVKPPLRVFITSAAPQVAGINSLGFGNARAEVFRYFGGRWWRENFTVQPGDRIGAAKVVRVTTAPKDKESDKPKDGASPAAPAASTPSSIDFSTDWFVLDVIEVPGADQQEVGRGFGATVLLQALASDASERRLPRQDASDPDLATLREKVRGADAGNIVARSDK
jgi:hypothetical protein